MYADNETDYIESCRQEINTCPNQIKSDGNSLCRKVLNALKNEKLLTARNGHGQLPPDFCSTTYGIMFDALRVNDTEFISEKGKYINNKFARERKMEKELKQLGMDIDDLERLRPLSEKLDEKHLYEKVIYDAYIENGCWGLTDEQRMEAYRIYNECKEQKVEE